MTIIILLLLNLNVGLCQQNYFGLTLDEVKKKMIEYKDEFKQEPEIGYKEDVGTYIIYYLNDGISLAFWFKNKICYLQLEHYSKNKYYPQILKHLNDNFSKEGEIWLEYKKEFFIVWELVLNDDGVLLRGTMNHYNKSQ